MAVTKKVKKDKNASPLIAGRRKTSVARVRVTNGTGNIIINKKDINEYFSLETMKQIVKQPLVLTNTLDKVDVLVNVYGGGLAGQAGAIRLGIARGLVKLDETYKPEIKKAGFLTRDARKKERKKYGLKKARKAPQFTKR
ncbi:MAG: 30S ribosomal protein S9 [Clostridia bacterium]|nr:30S ribosomal protein S9 [Clostridia bacterium]